MHCVVLTGFDRENKKVYIADPMKGNTEYDMTLFEKRFKDMGSQGVVIGRRYSLTVIFPHTYILQEQPLTIQQVRGCFCFTGGSELLPHKGSPERSH